MVLGYKNLQNWVILFGLLGSIPSHYLSGSQLRDGCVKGVWSSYYGISSDSRIEHWYNIYIWYWYDMYTWGIGDINQQDDMGLISLKIRWPRNLSLRPATDWASSVGPNRGWTASMAQGTTSSLIFSKYGYQWLPYGRVDRVILGTMNY